MAVFRVSSNHMLDVERVEEQFSPRLAAVKYHPRCSCGWDPEMTWNHDQDASLAWYFHTLDESAGLIVEHGGAAGLT